MEQRPVCLSIGGSDSCAGAGIQADLSVFDRLGVTGCSAITALTAQNPRQISRIEPVSLTQLDAELHAVFDYYAVAAIKTGMLVDAEHIAVVAAALDEHHSADVLVVDPVMVASSGRPLLDIAAVDTLRKALLPLASLVTPNLDEAAVWLGRPVDNAREDCRRLSDLFETAVLLKGGHREGKTLCDVLCTGEGETVCFEHPRLNWSDAQAHGSGCRLASSIAALAALHPDMDMARVVGRAIELCSNHP